MTADPKSLRVKVIICRILAVLVMLPSFLALALSWWAFDDSRKFLFKAGSAEATVVEVKQVEPANLYKPVIRFEDKNGETHTLDLSIATRNPSYKVDEKVPIVYAVDDPSTVRVDYWATHWGFASMAFTVFIIGVIIATILWIVVPAIMARKSGNS